MCEQWQRKVNTTNETHYSRENCICFWQHCLLFRCVLFTTGWFYCSCVSSESTCVHVYVRDRNECVCVWKCMRMCIWCTTGKSEKVEEVNKKAAATDSQPKPNQFRALLLAGAPKNRFAAKTGQTKQPSTRQQPENTTIQVEKSIDLKSKRCILVFHTLRIVCCCYCCCCCCCWISLRFCTTRHVTITPFSLVFFLLFLQNSLALSLALSFSLNILNSPANRICMRKNQFTGSVMYFFCSFFRCFAHLLQFMCQMHWMGSKPLQNKHF